MIKSSYIPHEPGVYVLGHTQLMQAYVGECKDLRHRASVWDYNFKQAVRTLSSGGSWKFPVKDFVFDPAQGEWTFFVFPAQSGVDAEGVRKYFEELGYKIINPKIRQRGLITYKGKEATLAEHARDAGIPYALAYKRRSRGKSMVEVLKPEEEK